MSSLPGYIDIKNTFNFVAYKTVLAEYGADTQDGKMEYKKQIIDDLTAGMPVREQIVGQSILGSKKFI